MKRHRLLGRAGGGRQLQRRVKMKANKFVFGTVFILGILLLLAGRCLTTVQAFGEQEYLFGFSDACVIFW